MDNFDQWCADRGHSIADNDGVVKANVTFTTDTGVTVRVTGDGRHFVDTFADLEKAGEWAREVLVAYFDFMLADAARIVAGAHQKYVNEANLSSISLHRHADGTVHDHTRQVGHGTSVLEPECPSCHQRHNENADCEYDKICLHESCGVAGIDYDESVCPSCGKNEHTPEELATCMESLLPPSHGEGCDGPYNCTCGIIP